MKNKIITIILGSICSYGAVQASQDTTNIEIKNIKQVAHSDGTDINGNTIGVNTFEGILYLKDKNYKTKIGYGIDDNKKVQYLLLSDMYVNPNKIDENVKKTKDELKSMGINVGEFENELKLYISKL